MAGTAYVGKEKKKEPFPLICAFSGTRQIAPLYPWVEKMALTCYDFSVLDCDRHVARCRPAYFR